MKKSAFLILALIASIGFVWAQSDDDFFGGDDDFFFGDDGIEELEDVDILDNEEGSNARDITAVANVSTSRLNSDYEQGGLYPDSGKEYANAKHIRSGYVNIEAAESIIIYTTEGYTAYIRCYSDRNAYTGSSSAITGTQTIKLADLPASTKYIRFLIKKTDDTDITPSASNAISATAEYAITKKINDLFVSCNKPIAISGLDSVAGVAHRGYSAIAPENTAAAFIEAAKAGFSTIETDVRFSAADANNPNGVPVLIHDATVNRTSNGTGNVADMTLAQLKALDFGSWFGSQFAGEQIMTLSEGIELCKKLGLRMILEIKTWDAATTEALYMIICNTVKSYRFQDRITISYDAAGALANFSGDNTLINVPLALIQNDIDENIATRINTLKAVTDKVIVSLNNTNATNEKIAQIISLGAEVYIWTVDTESAIKNMNLSISGVISNALNAPVILYYDAIKK